MSWKVLRSVDTTVVGRAGWCLVYARSMFRVGAKYPSAQTAYVATKHKHPASEKLPTVPVPVWFSWGVFGHVAVWVPNKGVYSSPISGTGRLIAKSPQDLVAIYKRYRFGLTYKGWSEDINGVRVAQYIAPPKPVVKPVTTYTVKSGDNLTKIAKAYKTTIAKLVSLNKAKYPSLVKNQNAIQIGWKLTVR